VIKSSEYPKITFGIIVLDGEPFTRYLLRQIYTHAFEIIIVEGGSEKASKYAPDGHASDGTLTALQEFKHGEDPEDKIRIISKNGFWAGKEEQCREFVKRIKGDYLWEVDIDEFYKTEDLISVRERLKKDRSIDTVSFRQIPFWGSIHCHVNGFKLKTDNSSQYHRLFRWKKGYHYMAHRPPTVVDENGVDLRKKKWLTARDTEKMGIHLYHYSLLFPKQVINKCSYYSNPVITEKGGGYLFGADVWADDVFIKLKKPFRVHNTYHHLSWLKQYQGTHPDEIIRLWNDLNHEQNAIKKRTTEDIERLLSNPLYSVAVKFLEFFSGLLCFPPFYIARKIFLNLRWIAVRNKGSH